MTRKKCHVLCVQLIQWCSPISSSNF